MSTNGQNGQHRDRPHVTYEELNDVAGDIELAPGEVHEVLSMGKDSVILFEKSQAAKDMAEQSALLYDLAALAIPTVDRARIDRLSLKRVNLIVAMASEQIELVRELARATGVAAPAKNPQPTEAPKETAAQAPSGSTT